MIDGFQFPWDDGPKPDAVRNEPELPEQRPRPRGRRPATPIPATGPQWLYDHLTANGPVEQLDSFTAAARGSGVTPWQLDFAAIEEEVFAQAVAQPASQRTLTIEGCRILARQFRQRVEAHRGRAAALVGNSFACPFDLHALLPVPSAILQLGPIHPAALAWLAKHWGVTDRLRQVVERPHPRIGRRLPANHAMIGYGFFTAGETPHAAIQQLTSRWPAVNFRLVPRPAS